MRERRASEGSTLCSLYSVDVCLACGLAPVMVIGEKIYPRVTPTKVDEVLVNLRLAAEEEARAGGGGGTAEGE